ncbi:hypothetical protein NLJ89_g2428 [Agrocybe chaxingu]|uniref:Peptidase M43 pregnancy-associated plasma-A domain-containing protein n=1 Tax=Agrocybe chaxingu TaxID=84603 RepID=A0A9W8MWH2_9AGAR|nr:hypothetical protein NLJ89_g2428 [Agrocybe chaxingu]
MKEAFERINLNKRQTTEIVFDVHFNVVASNTTEAGGWVPERMLINYGTLFRKGGATSLNINLILFGSDDETYGFGLPPSLYRGYPELDGIYVRFTALPGGASRVRQGSTVIHEAGHWLGLWHTFQDGCEGEGDGVADTPAEAGPASGCPIGRDSCPTLPGLDPVQNWMDYSAEGCRDSFTAGQIARMQTASRYRIDVLS